jgi:hypothetical protein
LVGKRSELMSKNQNHHLDDAPQIPANQKNQTSDDPRDGSRLTDKPEAIDTTAIERQPAHDRQDQDRIESLGERGVATTDKGA